MFRMLIYWECLLLRCKCICIVKLCLCRERNSFYNLVPIENAFWCNLSAFTFSASLPLNEGLWITFSASLYLFLSKCMHTFQFLVCLHVQEKKKKKSQFLVCQFCTSRGKKKNPSGTLVYETWVPLGKTEQNRAISWPKQSI